MPGRPLTYTIRIVNAGPDAADAVVVTDPLPDGSTFVSCATTVGTCSAPPPGSGGIVTATLGTLAAGATDTLTIVVNVTASSGSLVNTATATSSTPDPDPGNDTSTVVTTIGSAIPALSPPFAGLLALLLAAAALWFVRRE
jgi:large repetitive protein